jgi:hypothetical protein
LYSSQGDYIQFIKMDREKRDENSFKIVTGKAIGKRHLSLGVDWKAILKLISKK